MPILIILLLLTTSCRANKLVYFGSTPADQPVRIFLHMPLKDSIDFIKWKLVMQDDHYTLNCAYGLCRPGTDGFTNETRVDMQGTVVKQGSYYQLQYKGRTLNIVEINNSLVHLLDGNKSMLIGNGGWSYTLNRDSVILSTACSMSGLPIATTTAFQGRTPCQPLASLLKQQRSDACNKLKWYLILFIDPATKQPSHYLMGGRQYRQETMRKGNWSIERRLDGRYVYKLDPEKKDAATHLLQADENILLFTDASGNLLVGNDDFSYTLNKTYIR
jgi:hypothetical protein